MDKYLKSFFKNNWITLTITGLLMRGAAEAFTRLEWLDKVVDIFANAFKFIAGLAQ
jgi:hypothetical protein